MTASDGRSAAAVRQPGRQPSRQPGRQPSRAAVQLAFDIALAAGCLAVALTVHLSGAEAVPANRSPDAFSVLLTVAATAPVALRRRAPTAVLASTLCAVLALVVGRYAVGLTSLGMIVAFYTAVAHGTARVARAAIVAMTAATLATVLLDPVDLSAEGALVNAIVLVGAAVLGSGTRVRRDLHAAELTATEQRAEAQRRRAEADRERAEHAATEERLRISRELHDVIGHAMSVMVVQAGVAERLLDERPERARQAVLDIAATGRDSLAEMRRLLGAVRTPAPASGDLDPGPGRDGVRGLADVESLAARVRAAGLPVQVDVIGEPAGVAVGIDLAAYRIVQEALTNCLRHAGATRARVQVRHAADALELEIRDDGRGARGPERVGQGLAGMRERVAIYGGDLVTGPGADRGYLVRARFPLGDR